MNASDSAKHTPGPWRIITYSYEENNGRYVVGPNDDQPDDRLIADCYADCPLDLGLPSIQEMQANARLITAAPELLEFAALVARMRTLEEFGDGDDAPQQDDWIETLGELIASARALVGKAQGEVTP